MTTARQVRRMLEESPIKDLVDKCEFRNDGTAYATINLKYLFPGVDESLSIGAFPEESFVGSASDLNTLQDFLIEEGRLGTLSPALILCDQFHENKVLRSNWIAGSTSVFREAGTRSRDALRELLLSWFPSRVFNPYQSDHVVQPDMFFGREDDLSDLCESKRNYMVVGPRRVGKSCLAQQVQTRLVRQSKYRHRVTGEENRYWYSVCYLDLHTLTSIDDIWTSLLFDSMQLEARDTQPGSWLRPGVQERHRTVTPFELVRDLLCHKYKKALLLLDEVDGAILADEKNNCRVFRQLQSLIDAPESQMRVVLLGYKDLLRAWESDDFPLNHGRLKRKVLGTLNRDEVGGLIIGPMTRLGIKVERLPEIQDKMHHATAGMPNLLQDICRVVVDSDTVNESRCATMRDFHNILRNPSVREGIGQLFRQVKEPLPQLIGYQTVGRGRVSVTSVLKNLRSQDLPVVGADVKHALEQLVLYSVFHKASGHEYVFASNIVEELVQAELSHDPDNVIIHALEERIRTIFGQR